MVRFILAVLILIEGGRTGQTSLLNEKRQLSEVPVNLDVDLEM